MVVLGGNFRQMLSIIPNGMRQDVVYANINASYIWSLWKVLTLIKKHETSIWNFKWKCFLGETIFRLSIGNVAIGKMNDENTTIDISSYMLIDKFKAFSCRYYQQHIFLTFGNTHLFLFLHYRANLAQTNDIVDETKEYIVFDSWWK